MSGDITVDILCDDTRAVDEQPAGITFGEGMSRDAPGWKLVGIISNGDVLWSHTKSG
jgi:hypothetical protein